MIFYHNKDMNIHDYDDDEEDNEEGLLRNDLN